MSGGGFNDYFRPTLRRHYQADQSGYGGYTYTAPSRNWDYGQHSVPRFRSIPSFTDPVSCFSSLIFRINIRIRVRIRVLRFLDITEIQQLS